MMNAKTKNENVVQRENLDEYSVAFCGTVFKQYPLPLQRGREYG